VQTSLAAETSWSFAVAASQLLQTTLHRERSGPLFGPSSRKPS